MRIGDFCLELLLVGKMVVLIVVWVFIGIEGYKWRVVYVRINIIN